MSECTLVGPEIELERPPPGQTVVRMLEVGRPDVVRIVVQIGVVPRSRSSTTVHPAAGLAAQVAFALISLSLAVEPFLSAGSGTTSSGAGSGGTGWLAVTLTVLIVAVPPTILGATATDTMMSLTPVTLGFVPDGSSWVVTDEVTPLPPSAAVPW